MTLIIPVVMAVTEGGCLDVLQDVQGAIRCGNVAVYARDGLDVAVCCEVALLSADSKLPVHDGSRDKRYQHDRHVG